MRNSIKLLEAEVKELTALIKANMNKCGNYPSQLEILIGEHQTAINTLKACDRSTDSSRELSNQQAIAEFEKYLSS